MSDDNRKLCSSKEKTCETPNKKRGRRIKYHTDEERIEATQAAKSVQREKEERVIRAERDVQEGEE